MKLRQFFKRIPENKLIYVDVFDKSSNKYLFNEMKRKHAEDTFTGNSENSEYLELGVHSYSGEDILNSTVRAEYETSCGNKSILEIECILENKDFKKGGTDS